MDTAALATPLAAFTAGLVTSVHCAAMCGPLGCALLGGGKARRGNAWPALVIYHGTRGGAYALLGGVFGALGGSAAGLFGTSLSRVLPWAFALLFLGIAFGLDRYLPRPAFVSRLLFRLKLRGSDPRRSAALLGTFTPFLPCGPLYLVFGVALVAGSFLGGAQLMAAFALGTVPLLLVGQFGALHLQSRLPTATWQWTRRGLALVSALIVGGRAVATNPSLLAPVKCLFCP
jgi:sulfite exporter TauE/SafE